MLFIPIAELSEQGAVPLRQAQGPVSEPVEEQFPFHGGRRAERDWGGRAKL